MLKKLVFGAGLLSCLLLIIMGLAVWTDPASAPLPDQQRHYVISNVRVLDVDRGSFGPPVSVVIDNGLITEIGTDVAARPETHVDGLGGFLVPGFWDMHMHSFQLSPQLHFPLFVANGITNVRDMMDCPEPEDSLIACVDQKRNWSAAAESGKLAAPRFTEIASFYFERPDMTAEEAKDRARIYARRGVDSFKTYNRLSPGAYAALARAAEEHDLRLVGHLPQKIALGDALEAGHYSFEHAHLLLQQCFAGTAHWRAGKFSDLSPAVIAMRMVQDHDSDLCQAHIAAMSEAGVWLVPTHGTREEDARAADPDFLDDSRLAYLDPLSRWAFRDDQSATASRFPGKEGRRAAQDYFDKGLELTGKAHRAGIGILVGTDSVIGGFRYHDEMAHLVSAGLSPADVLRAATLDAARYAGLDSHSGSITIGKRADLVLLGANPLEDIRNTRNIRAVWLAGWRYDRSGLDALLQFTRDQSANPANWLRLLWGFARSQVAGEM